jgi:hypothetical protein
VICDKSYDNVPMPTFWNGYKKTPGHAVAYSDGTTGVIGSSQFNELNLSEFADVSGLDTNSTSRAAGLGGL